MGFLDKAKAMADDLAAKADTAISNSGIGGSGPTTADAERHLRDLGVVTYLETAGRPVPPGERERLLQALQAMEAAGVMGNLGLRTTAGAPPPPSPPPPPPPGPAPGPPPPPSWAKNDDS